MSVNRKAIVLVKYLKNLRQLMRQYILLLTNCSCFENDNVWPIVFKMDNFVNCRLQYKIDH